MSTGLAVAARQARRTRDGQFFTLPLNLNTEALLRASPAAYANDMSTSLIYPNGVIELRPVFELKVQHLDV